MEFSAAKNGPFSVSGKGFSCRVELGNSTSRPTEAPPANSTTTQVHSECPPPSTKCSCGQIKRTPVHKGEPDQNKIIGGKEAKPHSYPWQLAISLKGQVFCAATLIAKKQVLTAAHCIEYMEKRKYQLKDVKVNKLNRWVCAVQ